jgi:hypothetical protein
MGFCREKHLKAGGYEDYSARKEQSEEEKTSAVRIISSPQEMDD